MPFAARRLKAREVERLENTSGAFVPGLAPGGADGCGGLVCCYTVLGITGTWNPCSTNCTATEAA